MINLNNKAVLFIIFFIGIITSYGQIPQKMSYQSVIRNIGGDLVVNATIGVQISILKDSDNGTVVYSETQTNTTNENGLLSIEIGGGTPVTGTFSSINWATGIYFVKTQTDPSGGNNYTIVGTGQLLSVPYALYSANSSNQGKSTIFLTGEITNSEATAQITSELGPNTENIIISNTSQLTSVDLSMITSLLNLDINDNSNLTTVNLSGLTAVYKDISISANPLLTVLNFPALAKNPKNTTIESNESLTSISFPALLKTRSSSGFFIRFNASLTSISFSSMSTMGVGSDFSINNNLNLINILFPSLTNIYSFVIDHNQNLSNLNLNLVTQTAKITIAENNLSSFSLPILTKGEVSINETNLNSISLPLLSNGIIGLYNSLVTNLSLPSLANGSIDVLGNSLLTSILFPQLTNCEGIMRIQNNIQLNTIAFPILTTFTNLNDQISFSNNSLTSTSINYILNKIVNTTPLAGKNIIVSGQVPIAAPTGQGLIDKQTLIDNGNSVYTD
jgi:hypothetical protein